MKRRITAILLCALIAMLAASPLFALEISDTELARRVVDGAELLSDEEEAALREGIKSVISDYSTDVVFVTTNDTGGKTAIEFADDYFDYNGYGFGDEYDGIILIIAMDLREYQPSTCGRAIDAFTDDTIDIMSDEIWQDVADGNYYEAFSHYLSCIDEVLAKNATGEPYDISNSLHDETENLQATRSPWRNALDGWLIITAVAVVFAFIVTSVMKKNLKNVGWQREAMSYIRPGSFNLSESRDLLLYTTTSRVRVNTESSGGGGGGGSSRHVSSSGRSHGGGGGGRKF